jgi:hypothetical protein
MSPENEALIEAVVGAHRERDRDGRPRAHPAFHDLDAEGRLDAFERALVTRRLEAALDPGGLSTTARAVLARLARVR